MTPVGGSSGSAGALDEHHDAHPGAREDRGHQSNIELVAGGILVAAVVLGGLYFSFRPAAGTLDRWLGDLVPQSRSRWLVDISRLRYPVIIVIGSIIAAAVCFPRNRRRALACLVGPPLALVACELVVKPLVGRTLGGSLSYPSGSTVGASALATVAVLVVPARWRAVTMVLAAAYVVWVTVAVVALQWHFPTDALAGVAFGVGVVLLVDGTSWWVFDQLGRAVTRRRRLAVGDRAQHGGPVL